MRRCCARKQSSRSLAKLEGFPKLSRKPSRCAVTFPSACARIFTAPLRFPALRYLDRRLSIVLRRGRRRAASTLPAWAAACYKWWAVARFWRYMVLWCSIWCFLWLCALIGDILHWTMMCDCVRDRVPCMMYACGASCDTKCYKCPRCQTDVLSLYADVSERSPSLLNI